jgi:hypothetical protein
MLSRFTQSFRRSRVAPESSQPSTVAPEPIQPSTVASEPIQRSVENDYGSIFRAIDRNTSPEHSLDALLHFFNYAYERHLLDTVNHRENIENDYECIKSAESILQKLDTPGARENPDLNRSIETIQQKLEEVRELFRIHVRNYEARS